MRGAIVALLVGWASIAQAEEASTAEVERALAEGRHADAYRIAGELVSKYGADPDVRYFAADACLRTARFSEAAQHVTAGLAEHASDVDLLGLRSKILLYQGDEDGARASAERALELQPDAGDASITLEDLNRAARARARLQGERVPLEAEERFVDQLIERVADGAAPSELADAFDLEILSSTPPEQRTRENLVAAIAGALRAARREADEAGQRYLGWLVTGHTPGGDARVVVDVAVPIEATFTKLQRDTLAAAVDDPALRGTADPTMVVMVEGVPPDEREALLDRMLGVRFHAVIDLHFEVAGTGGDFHVTDLLMGEISLKAQLANLGELYDKVTPPRAGFRLSPEVIGTFAGIVAGIVVVVVLATRRRRR